MTPASTLAIAVLLLGCASEPDVEQRSTLEHGRALFADVAASDSSRNVFSCATCHASGDVPTDRILPGAPMAGVTERPTYWGGQELDLLRAVNHCRFYFMQAQRPWTSNDEDAKAMYVFLASLPPAHSSAQPFSVVATAADLPMGDASRGRSVYERSCRSCHGEVHSGDRRLASHIPVLPDESVASFQQFGFDRIATRITFIEKVRHGGFLGLYGNMPPYSLEAMRDEDLGSLLSYLGLY